MLPLLPMLLTGAALAQSATPGSVVTLDAVSVEAARQTPADRARERLAATPGGTALLDDADLAGRSLVNLHDALRTVPGVIVQSFFGGNDQPRVQIRGSGLQQNPVERGILNLFNGLPLNRADGSYIVGLTAPTGAEMLEIYRGYTANRLGATVLGGAVNIISPTGSSQPGARIALMGGSFGQVTSSAQIGGKQDGIDGLIRLDDSRRDGFREHNDSARTALDANIGARLSEHIRTRFFAGYTDLAFDVTGPLPQSRLDSDPTQAHRGPVVVGGVATEAGPNVLRDRPRRETRQWRLGNRASADFDDHVIDLALGYARTDDVFYFPISSGVRDIAGNDYTLNLRYAYQPDPGQTLPLVELTALYQVGDAERRDYHNLRGQRGSLFGRSDQEASTLSLHAGLNLPLGAGVTLSPSLAVAQATRINRDRWGSPTRPTIAFSPTNPGQAVANGQVAAGNTSYDRDYTGFTPALGLSWRPASDHLLFAALSRSFEPPTHEDLLATVNGTPNSSAGRPNPGNPAQASSAYRTPDLKAQTGTSAEIGWRGRVGPVAVDAGSYYAWLRRELLSLRDSTGASLGAVNAGETRHFGLELGLSARLGTDLRGRLAYTYQDFRFHNDPSRGDNRLAGAPPHQMNLTLDYALSEALSLRGDINWRIARTPVDNANTLYADPFVTVDLRVDYRVTPDLGLFVEGRNLFDVTYAASTLVVDQVSSRSQAVFLPGDGRAVYAGLRARF